MMKFDYEHPFTIDEAQERVQALCDYLQNRHGIQVAWNGREARFDGKYMVVHIRGTMVVGDSNIRFEGKDPGMLWRKKATKYLTEKLALYLDPKTSADDLPRDAH